MEKAPAVLHRRPFENQLRSLVIQAIPSSRSVTVVPLVTVCPPKPSVTYLRSAILSVVSVTIIGPMVTPPTTATSMIVLPILAHLIAAVIGPISSLSSSICRESDKCGSDQHCQYQDFAFHSILLSTFIEKVCTFV